MTQQDTETLAIENAAKYVLDHSRRGSASLNSEQFAADTEKLMAAYRDIINKALASGHLAALTRRAGGDDAEREALAGYRAAVSFIAADSWDGCSDCIETLKAARVADWQNDQAADPDETARQLARIRAHRRPVEPRAGGDAIPAGEACTCQCFPTHQANDCPAHGLEAPFDGVPHDTPKPPAGGDAIPAGMVVVPRVATRAMVEAADACSDAYSAWAAMVEVSRVR